MACRALCRSIHRPARSLLSTGGFSRHRLQINSPLIHTPLPSGAYFRNPSPFSSSPDAGFKEAERGISDGVEEGSISSSNAQELAAPGSLEIPSPVDLATACLDTLHNITGLPWWATISVSAILLRALMFPLRVIQTHKLAEIKNLGPKLQLESLVKGLSQGKFLEECRQLRKRKQQLSCPSLLWILGPGIFIQVPLVMIIMYSLRRMALEKHVGFATGGMMWFKDLTVSGEGLVGAMLPLIVASVYLASVHVLFRGHPVRKGLMGDLEKDFQVALKFFTLFIFWGFYHAPQALHAFYIPHSVMTLSQTALFENEKFVARVIGPRTNAPLLSGGQYKKVLSSYEKLLKDAGSCFTSGNSLQAIELLKAAIEEEPEQGEAFALLGLVFKTQKDWVNSALYYKQAISKGDTDDFKIAAYAGCGLALLKEGAVMECIETMRPIRSFRVPERPDSRHCYYASLVILGRALLEAGLTDESQDVVRLYNELDMEKSMGQSS